MNTKKKLFSAARRMLALCMLVLTAVLCACSAEPEAVPEINEADVTEMQRLYRNSSLVVVADCFRTHLDAAGRTCCDVTVERTVAGTITTGNDVLHCPNGGMKEGEIYLLYLAEGQDVYQSEDMDSYTIVGDTAFRIKNDVVYTETSVMDIADVESAIREANRVISVQGESLYYRTLSTLSKGSDYIFIGKIKEMPELSEMSFRSNENGAIIENELPASLIKVEVYGSIKGELNYGDEIEVVYCPSMADDIVDAATLKPATFSESKLPTPEEGGTYLFFLAEGPDEKQEYYFGVNPLQFIAKLSEDDCLSVSGANRALSGYRSLDAVVRNIRKAIDG